MLFALQRDQAAAAAAAAAGGSGQQQQLQAAPAAAAAAADAAKDREQQQEELRQRQQQLDRLREDPFAAILAAKTALQQSEKFVMKSLEGAYGSVVPGSDNQLLLGDEEEQQPGAPEVDGECIHWVCLCGPHRTCGTYTASLYTGCRPMLSAMGT